VNSLSPHAFSKDDDLLLPRVIAKKWKCRAIKDVAYALFSD